MSWSKGEKKIARAAFEKAYARETAALIQQVQQKATQLESPESLWQLHDFLRETLGDVEQKYDYRYSVLDIVFARLIREGRLTLDELAGLAEEKLERLRRMTSASFF
ncbi:MAG: hypothetical protein AAF614_29495 [Chloroflexota bacterium]